MTSARPSLFLAIGLMFIGLGLTSSFAVAQKESVAIIFDTHNKTFSFTASEMKKTLEKGGYKVALEDVTSLKDTKAGDRFILTTRGTAEANTLNRLME
jgi:uncharacterized protein YaiE (UPF0345 family)